MSKEEKELSEAEEKERKKLEDKEKEWIKEATGKLGYESQKEELYFKLSKIYNDAIKNNTEEPIQ